MFNMSIGYKYFIKLLLELPIKASSDEEAVRRTEGEMILQVFCFLYLRLLLRKIHLPHQREAKTVALYMRQRITSSKKILGNIPAEIFAGFF